MRSETPTSDTQALKDIAGREAVAVQNDDIKAIFHSAVLRSNCAWGEEEKGSDTLYSETAVVTPVRG